MGGSTSKDGSADDALKSRVNCNSGKPYFFLASCPSDSTAEATRLADKYGGFHCLSEGGEGFSAWKGKAEGQFLTLKRLSPAGRKIICIAIAGFGHCNDEREFLQQMGKRPDHDQFELKQCGDTRDMERWLQSEGYRAVLGSATASTRAESFAADETGRTQPVAAAGAARTNIWDSVHSFIGQTITGGGDVWKERWVMDVQRALTESEAVDTSSPEALREAKEKLATAVRNAAEVGVPAAELQTAKAREKELQQLIKEAESRRGFCRWCCADAHEWRRTEEARARDEQYESQVTKADAMASEAERDRLDGKIKALEADIRQREQDIKQQQQQLSMRTMLPARCDSIRLPVGTKCRYKSARNGWMSAKVEGFNSSDNTYNLDVRPHANLGNIYPAGDVPASKAWPAGTLVEYESSTAGHWLEAVIRSFNEGSAGTYNLDIRDRATVDRVRLRAG